MKKTLLIAAMAISSVALATTTLEDSVLFMRDNTLTQTTSISSLGTGDFSYSFLLTQKAVDLLIEAVGSRVGATYAKEYIVLKGDTNCNFGIAQGYSSTSGTIHTSGIYMCASDVVNTTNGVNNYQGGGVALKNNSTTDYLADVKSIAITFTAIGNASGTNMHMTITYNSGNVNQWSTSGNNDFMYGAFSDWSTLEVNTDLVSSVALFDSVLSQADARSLNAAHASLTTYSGDSSVSGDLALAGSTYFDKAVAVSGKITAGAGTKLYIASIGSLTNDGFIYSHGGVIAETGTDKEQLSLWQDTVIVSDLTVSRNGTDLKTINAKMVNVDYVQDTGNTGTTQFCNDNNTFGSIAVNDGTVEINADATVSGDIIVGGNGAFVVAADKELSIAGTLSTASSKDVTLNGTVALGSGDGKVVANGGSVIVSGAGQITGTNVTIAAKSNAKLRATGEAEFTNTTVSNSGITGTSKATSSVTGAEISVNNDATGNEYTLSHLTLDGTNVTNANADLTLVLDDVAFANGATVTSSNTNLTLGVDDVTWPWASVKDDTLTVTYNQTGLTLSGDLTLTISEALMRRLQLWNTTTPFTTLNIDFGEGNDLSADTNLSVSNLFGFPTVTDASIDGNIVTVTFSDYVPEPTTGTLAVLALAGLAARRRRK